MINDYNEIRDCIYKDEHYSVRDNGAVMRHLRVGKKARKDDEVWTFGNKDPRTGYMMLGKHRVHIIVATAFYGERDTATFVVDHKDTNRCNNRIENLHWLTKLENILNNEITRNKIIRICGSIEAFIENPQLLQKSNMPDTSFEWMRAVTAEEAKIAYENIKKYWEEQARNPHPISGTRMDDNIYHKQLNPSKRYQTPDMSTPKMFDTLSDTSFDTNDNRHVVTDDDWERITKSFRETNTQEPIVQEYKEPEIKEYYKMSLTPKAALIPFFMDDKPGEYPSTPQGEYDNPLQVYAEALTPGAVYWRNHNGKREYVVDKRDFSTDGQTLVVISKANYVWGKDENGEPIEVPLSTLEKDEYDDSELHRQLNEITYRDGLFFHKRHGGFFTSFYLEEDYKELTTKE